MFMVSYIAFEFQRNKDIKKKILMDNSIQSGIWDFLMRYKAFS